MPTINGITVYCSANGNKLWEYTDTTLQQTERQRECYIKAEDGQKFSFTLDTKGFKKTPSQSWDMLDVRLVIDGVGYNNGLRCGETTDNRRLALYSTSLPVSAAYTRTWNSLTDRSGQAYELRFSVAEFECNCSEGHVYPSGTAGQIEIRLYRYQQENHANKLPVHTKHAAGYDMSSSITLHKTTEGYSYWTPETSLDSPENPFMIFRFFYRPQRYLKHIGLNA